MSTSLTQYRRRTYYPNPGMSDTTLIIGAVLLMGIILYLLLRTKTGTLGAMSTMPTAKQWKISYNEDGMMSGIQMIEMPKE